MELDQFSVGQRPIGAAPASGDGTLSRFLNDQGTPVIATDDLSWSYAIKYSEAVENSDAKLALAKYQPQAVITHW